jgi:hypothetical protein
VVTAGAGALYPIALNIKDKMAAEGTLGVVRTPHVPTLACACHFEQQ